MAEWIKTNANVLNQFRNGSVSYLLQPIWLRGLDIPEMKHVIHYHLPSKGDTHL
jgi:superfamily II DNA/RNA helicase